MTNPDYFWTVLYSGPIAALLFFVPIWGPRVAFFGLCAKLPLSNNRLRFTISDMLVLVAYLAIANSLTSIPLPNSTVANHTALAVCSNLLALLVWIKCIRFMQSCGIQNIRSRLLVQLFVYPCSVLSVSYIAISTVTLIFWFVGFPTAGSGSTEHFLIVGSTLIASTAWLFAVRCVFKLLSVSERGNGEMRRET